MDNEPGNEPGNEPTYLYLTTTGWKSGKAHEIEIWFVRHAQRYYLISERRERAHWVQNIQRHAAITFRVGETTFTGTGRTVDSDAEPAVAEAVIALMTAKYGWGEGLIVELMPGE